MDSLSYIVIGIACLCMLGFVGSSSMFSSTEVGGSSVVDLSDRSHTVVSEPVIVYTVNETASIGVLDIGEVNSDSDSGASIGSLVGLLVLTFVVGIVLIVLVGVLFQISRILGLQ